MTDREIMQPEQDVPATCFGNMVPVGWLESPDGEFRANPLYKIKFPSSLLSWQVPLYMALPEQEPVALVIDGVLVKSELPEKYTGHLYTTPPQRTWVALTTADRKEIERQSVYVEGAIRMTEAKLKEKNNV